MNQRTGFYRKLAYGAAIAALLFPLSLLSSPATVESAGGTLAQLRSEHRLGQGDLGEIDPASETIKLATLGLRGLAVNILWEKANHYKKVEDWTNLSASLEQLAKLQPNFTTFWEYQSWNLSYNVSVEFDDYRDRYYWVRRGIQFLEKGNDYNRDNPELLTELGWVLGQKIGRSDEKRQYRRLFKADDEYHPTDRLPEQRDNWLVSKGVYLDSVASVEERGKSYGRKSPIVFYSAPAKSQISYSEAIGEEGLFERAVRSWGVSEGEWVDFGNLPIEHSSGVVLRLGEAEQLLEQIETLEQQLKSMLGDFEDEIVQEQRSLLTEEEVAALAIPKEDRTMEQVDLAFEAEAKLVVTPDKIAAKVVELHPERRLEATQLAAEIRDLSRRLNYTDAYKGTANYNYWLLRCRFEQTDQAVSAHELVLRAQRAFNDDGDPLSSKRHFEESFRLWAEIFEMFPGLMDTELSTGDDVMSYVYQYKRVLDQLDEPMPDDFPLWELVRNFDTEAQFTIELREHDAAAEAATEGAS